ncbi:hypothetical protein [Pseudomonas sp. HLT2-19-2]
MSEQNTSTHPDNIEHPTNNEDAPLTEVVNETSISKTRAKFADIESSADRKRGTGGLDSLGGGRLI